MNSNAKFDEVAFTKQLNNFEAAMQNDLNSRVSDTSSRWNFNFSHGKPAEESKELHAMKWEPISPAVQQQTRPRLQISRPIQQKPKMSLGTISDKDSGNPFQTDFGLANRFSLASSEHNTESTAGESMFSMCSSSVGKNGSIVDFGRRTSFAMNHQLRRKTEIAKQPRASTNVLNLNDRPSNIEEGPINQVNSAPINQNKVRQNTIREEESREQFQPVACEPVEILGQKHSGSGSGRRHSAIRSFCAGGDVDSDPFSTALVANPSENLKKEDEDCDALDEEDVSGLEQMLKQNSSGINNKNRSFFGESDK